MQMFENACLCNTRKHFLHANYVFHFHVKVQIQNVQIQILALFCSLLIDPIPGVVILTRANDKKSCRPN